MDSLQTVFVALAGFGGTIAAAMWLNRRLGLEVTQAASGPRDAARASWDRKRLALRQCLCRQLNQRHRYIECRFRR